MIDPLLENLEGTSVSLNFLEDLDQDIEYVSLPSKGYFFTGKYKNIDKIKVKKISYKEEIILTTDSYYHNDTLLEEILKSVIVDKSFPLHELTQVDRDVIFIWLKVGVFGQIHSSYFKCNKEDCKTKIKVDWDIAQLKMPEYSLTHIEDLKVKGYVTYNKENIEFRITLPSIKRLKEVEEYIGDKTNKGVTTSRLLSFVKEVVTEGGVYNSPQEIAELFRKINLSFEDSRKIQKIIEEINLKIETLKEVSCPKCNSLYNLSMLPVTKHFFGIDSKSYKEYLLETINYLNFWGKLDYQSCLRMPAWKRKKWAQFTEKNLKLLNG